jgi:hypothetical protein
LSGAAIQHYNYPFYSNTKTTSSYCHHHLLHKAVNAHWLPDTQEEWREKVKGKRKEVTTVTTLNISN